jgi:hypothetical protein
MEVKFKKLTQDAVLPTYANPNDAGLDLTATRFTQEFDKSGKMVLVYHTDLAVEIPEGYVGLVFMRSSVSQRSLSLCNCVGVVDCDYKNEIMCKFKLYFHVIFLLYCFLILFRSSVLLDLQHSLQQNCSYLLLDILLLASALLLLDLAKSDLVFLPFFA